MDFGIVDLVKRELSDIRFSQSETDRRTQDSLETVHNTLGHVVDRLAMIEGDLRAVRAAPVRRSRPRRRQMRAERRARRCRRAFAPPHLLQPDAAAAAETGTAKSGRAQEDPQEHFAAAPREFHAAQPAPPPCRRRCRRAPSAKSSSRTPHRRAPRSSRICRPIIRSSRARGRPARVSSPSERIAASESAISEIRGGRKSRSARRASSPPRAAPRRPPPPRRLNEKAGRAAQGRAKAKARRQGQGRTQDPLDHHLQDPLAAGRRERGRDRARHLQDGDDAARQRQRAANAADGKFESSRPPGAGAAPETAPSPRCRAPARPR